MPKIQRNKYRRLKVGEIVESGDYANSIINIKKDGNLCTDGWIEAFGGVGKPVTEDSTCAYFRLKSDEQTPSGPSV